MPLELNHLERAISALEAGLAITRDDGVMGQLDEVAQNVMMSGVVQHFEFTYEICRVLIERWLRENYGREVLSVSRKEVYRIAGERDLIEGTERWFVYHEERNRTTHRYDEELLNLLDDTIPNFISDANSLFEILRSRSAGA